MRWRRRSGGGEEDCVHAARLREEGLAGAVFVVWTWARTRQGMNERVLRVCRGQAWRCVVVARGVVRRG